MKEESKTEREEHLEYIDMVGLSLVSEDDVNYNCVWKGTSVGMWFRKEGMTEMIKVERELAKKQMEMEYELWFGKYERRK